MELASRGLQECAEGRESSALRMSPYCPAPLAPRVFLPRFPCARSFLDTLLPRELLSPGIFSPSLELKALIPLPCPLLAFPQFSTETSALLWRRRAARFSCGTAAGTLPGPLLCERDPSPRAVLSVCLLPQTLEVKERRAGLRALTCVLRNLVSLQLLFTRSKAQPLTKEAIPKSVCVYTHVYTCIFIQKSSILTWCCWWEPEMWNSKTGSIFLIKLVVWGFFVAIVPCFWISKSFFYLQRVKEKNLIYFP